VALGDSGLLPRYNLSNPRRAASATASVRLVTFILAKIAFPCDLTVPSPGRVAKTQVHYRRAPPRDRGPESEKDEAVDEDHHGDCRWCNQEYW
jgi:hypothetical protein